MIPLDIVADLANFTQVINFFITTTVTIAQMFTQWPLVLVPGVAIAGIVFAKAKGIVKLRR